MLLVAGSDELSEGGIVKGMLIDGLGSNLGLMDV